MIAYLETQNRYGEKELCALIDGVEIARITKTENMGKPQYCVGITWERERSEFLGRAATIAGAKKKPAAPATNPPPRNAKRTRRGCNEDLA